MPVSFRRMTLVRAACAAVMSLILLGSFSCDSIIPFNPDGEYFVNVPKPVPPPGLAIDLANSADTIPVWGNASFAYTVNPSATLETLIKCYIDSAEYFPVIENGIISISTQYFTNGYHTLRIEYFVPTGSNSLASRYAGEYFYVQVKKTILIDNTPPDVALSAQISRIGGHLVLSWTRYDRINFQGYIILRTFPVFMGYESVADTIRDHSVTSYTDSTFVGGSVTYRVMLMALGTTKESDQVRYDSPYLKTEAVLNPDTTVTVTWQSCPYPENFEKYVVYLGSDYHSWLFVDSSRDISDTIVTDHQLRFGLGDYYTVQIFSRPVHGRQDSILVNTNFIYLGTAVPQFNRIEFVSSNNSYYLSRSDSSYRLNAGDFSVAASTDGQIAVTTDGTRACKMLNGTVTEIDPLTFTSLRQVQLPGSGVHGIWMTAPDNMLYAVMNLTQSITLINLDSVANATTIGLGNEFATAISPNGHYMLVSSGLLPATVIRVEHDTIAGRVSTDVEYSSDFTFIDDGDRFAEVSSNTIFEKNCIDGSTVQTISAATNVGSPSEDPITHRLGVYLYGAQGVSQYLVYDITTGKLVQTIPLRLPTWYTQSFSICNNVVFTGVGYCLPLHSP